MIKKFYLATLLLLTMVVGFLPSAFAQQRITGKVTDQGGAPVIGAAVLVRGTTNGAVTEADGSYTLANVPANATLEISCLGYQTETVAVGGRNVINVTMLEDTEMVEETVVIGYAVQRKSDVTGAVASIKTEELENRVTEGLGEALMGKAAGVMILSSSGAPGEGTSIRVRGYSSNSSGSSNPLYIVDGMKVSNINYIDTHNVESIEVLKDAASAAIYGAEAGNGVVLITTKQGKAGEGRIFFNASVALQNNASRMDVMNAKEFVDFQTAIGRGSVFANWNGTETNWIDHVFETGIFQRYTVGAQGGNENGNYFASLTSMNNNGMVAGPKDYMNRISGQINASYKIKKWFQVQSNITIDHTKRGTVSAFGTEQGNMVGGAFQMDPTTPLEMAEADIVKYGFGTIPKAQLIQSREGYYWTPTMYASEMTHPFINRDNNEGFSGNSSFRGVFSGILTPFKGFVFTSRLGFNFGGGESWSYTRPYYGDPVGQSTNMSLTETTSRNYTTQWENFANYSFKLGASDFTAMAGMSYRANYSLSTGVNVNGLTSDNPVYRYVNNASSSATRSIQGGSPSESSQLGYFGRLTWAYKGRYNAQVNFRADAFDASKLSKKARWGYFPSASIGWTPSNEAFFKDNINPEVWSYLKFRASWGKNGNVNVLSGYPYAATLSNSTNGYYMDGALTSRMELRSGRLPNPDLKWEESVQLDLGVDMRFFRDRLTATIDYFDKATTDLLVSVAPPRITGASAVYKNLGLIRNRGLEFELGWKQQLGDFSYSINGNLSTLYNMVEDLGGLGRQGGAQIHSSSLIATYFEKGYPLWYMRGYIYEGMEADGTPKYKDVNGNGMLDPDDKDYMGDAIPDFTYGLTLQLNWKFLDFSVVGSGSKGANMWLVVYRPNKNQIKDFWYDSYYVKGTSARYPAVTEGNWSYFLDSSAVVYDASYFKIKQMQLGVTLPSKWTNKIAVQSLRFFASLDNYFTFTKYPGPDPEIMQNGSEMGMDKHGYPVSKNMTFGVNVSF